MREVPVAHTGGPAFWRPAASTGTMGEQRFSSAWACGLINGRERGTRLKCMSEVWIDLSLVPRHAPSIRAVAAIAGVFTTRGRSPDLGVFLRKQVYVRTYVLSTQQSVGKLMHGGSCFCRGLGPPLSCPPVQGWSTAGHSCSLLSAGYSI